MDVGSVEVKMMCLGVIMMATTTALSHLDNLQTYTDHSPPGPGVGRARVISKYSTGSSFNPKW